jgi:RNA polymerase sigma-70 factor (ECF subfamily)
MATDSLDTLLAKLTSGDDVAAGKIFVKYEPLLRMVVRKSLSAELRTKFDSMDIVQSVWADLIRGFRDAGWRFVDAAHLRAFLIRLTRHRFIDRLRRHQYAISHGQSLTNKGWESTVEATDPGPDQVAEAEELWKEILLLCPPEHREILRLKREGALTSDVAAKTGLHEGSVRRILCNLARRMAKNRGTEEGSGS